MPPRIPPPSAAVQRKTPDWVQRAIRPAGQATAAVSQPKTGRPQWVQNAIGKPAGAVRQPAAAAWKPQKAVPVVPLATIIAQQAAAAAAEPVFAPPPPPPPVLVVAPVVDWEIAPSAGNHYDDGWGAMYGIRTNAQLKASVLAHGTAADGDQDDDLGRHTVGSHFSACNIRYSNTWNAARTLRTIRVWHCGPSLFA